LRPEEEQIARSAFLEAWAVESLTHDSTLDLVILGHTHTPMLKEMFPGRYYLNLGDWLGSQTYAILGTGEAPRLLDWQNRGSSEPNR
jgi:UDP-2,3-diacylglucosamine pyrophosphatase LpxH